MSFELPNTGVYSWDSDSRNSGRRKRKRKKKRAPDAPPTEAMIQGRIVDAAKKALPGCVVASYPNEVRRSGVQAVAETNRRRSMGMKPGMPDLSVWWRGRVLLLEVKAKRGSLLPSQKKTHAELAATGFDVRVVRSVEDAEEAFAALRDADAGAVTF